MTLPHERKRARSQAEKAGRRAAILSAARRLVERDGFDAVTMAGVAAEAGLSKGALYLYVRAKEELFLSLFLEALEQVTARIEADARDRATLIAAMGRAPLEAPLFVPLLARLTTVIEPALEDAALFDAKRRMRDMGLRAAAVIARATGADDARAWEASAALMLTMQGAAQFDVAARRDAVAAPDDLRPMLERQGFAQTFPAAARLILSGLGDAGPGAPATR
ncbi:TetR/AcrR family transcriptional regulator [Rhodovulum sp. DZ06]|uniref:TetR/AcrR family transcriptional regulator n=1 Tax=Rhodovulum sp. DZ06 TaxID=3425126 RepID=UPI003D339FF6